jgi:signal transduction histidine kinase
MEPVAEAHARSEELIRLIAHDLRNPLSAVQINGQLIERAAAEQGLAKEARWARSIVEAARRMDDMLGKLVECERIRSGRLPLRLTQVALDALVRDLAERHAAHSSGGVEVTGAAPPTSVRADRVRLTQALDALVGIAAEQCDPTRGIAIEVATEGERAVCRIRAPQSPAASETAPAESPARGGRGNPGGQAIALHYAQSLLESQGGTLTVAQVPATATTFTIGLPQASAART